MVKVCSKLQRVCSRNDAEVIGQLQTRFAIEVHVRSRFAGNNQVGNLERGLLDHRPEIKTPAGPLDARFVDFSGAQDGCVADDERLIEQIVVPAGR